ncbi:unnamed protein product [Schistosoma margrebowiei]|uniref:Uncharacterized protein n=1 Tax=Schistosoma margrebowiei TaxID=48269 RepID=A0A3P7VY79_9TREM|nr:unnamed protein product [Schistosoma margrebowiei]
MQITEWKVCLNWLNGSLVDFLFILNFIANQAKYNIRTTD